MLYSKHSSATTQVIDEHNQARWNRKPVIYLQMLSAHSACCRIVGTLLDGTEHVTDGGLVMFSSEPTMLCDL